MGLLVSTKPPSGVNFRGDRTGREVKRASWRRWAERIGLTLAVIVVIGLPLAGFLLPLPFSPVEPDTSVIGLAPSALHWFGTDSSGFDVFSRTIDSAAQDVPLALAATVIAAVIGVPLGLFATQGAGGEFVMRIMDALSALPIIVIVIVFVQVLGGHAVDVVGAIAVVGIPRFVRVSRASAITLRSARFVEAAVAIGCSPLRVAVNHILRNSYGVVLVQATLTVAAGVSAIAALNFLGIGVSPPTPTWGSMINDGTSMMIRGEWWASVFPMLAIVLFLGALNVVGNAFENRMEAPGGAA